MSLIPAATVIVLREPFEVFLIKRHAKSGFMAGAFVFPGGKVDAADEVQGEDDVLAFQRAGARELAEEAGLHVQPSDLHYFAHWITPTSEARRFSARFFLTILPQGQTAEPDLHEATEGRWLAPGEALRLQTRGELPLPPPTLKNLEDLATLGTLDNALSEAARRSSEVLPILPKFSQIEGLLSLLLPWDVDYEATPGESLCWPKGHRLAQGTSRIVLKDGKWWTK